MGNRSGHMNAGKVAATGMLFVTINNLSWKVSNDFRLPAAKSVWHRGANQLIRQSVLPQEGIEMAQIKFGYQIDFRNPPASGRSFTDLYHAMFRQIERAEQLGFDSIWLTEHHLTDDGYLPSLMPMAAAIAARTRRVQIGTYVLLFPFYHPIKLAEDIAVVDVISGGRLRIGVGQAYRAEEFAAFGIDKKQRLGRTLET